MEYFILVDNIKQGPFDLITMIKKVKNGTLTAETMVSDNIGGLAKKASEFEDIADIIAEHSNPTIYSSGTGESLKMTFKTSFQEGLELWTRRIIDYTLIAMLIMAMGFGFQSMGQMVTGGVFPVYIGTAFTMALFFEFCFYVLETKRSQKADLAEVTLVIKRTIAPFFGISLVISSFVLFYALGREVGFIATVIAMVALTYLIFMPFLATDGNMSIRRAAALSFQKVKSMGADNFGVVLAIIAVNLFAAILPAMANENLLGLGLFLSLPITFSAVAYIYDQIFV